MNKTRNHKLDFKQEIRDVFGIAKKEIKEFKKLSGSNIVYSFVVKNQKYVIKKLNDSSIMNWEQEKSAYNTLKELNITDELVYFDNGVKITKFLEGSKTLGYSVADMTKAIDMIRGVHESGISINFDYNIIEHINKYLERCDKNSKDFKDMENSREIFTAIQEIIDKLNIPKVLCHGDACVNGNYLRLPDKSVKIIDWEQAGMADPLLDITNAALHQGFLDVDPVWCLHQYLKRIPNKQEYLRLYSLLALGSYEMAAWCLYENPEDYDYYFCIAVKYSSLVWGYYRDDGSSIS